MLYWYQKENGLSNPITLTFLGSGSAFTVGSGNFHSNILLSSENSKFLIDCGSDIRFSAYEQGLSFDDFNEVYVSHLHGDHAGGLEWLGINRKLNSNLPKPILHSHSSLIQPLWENVLSGGMSTIEDRDVTLEDFFKVDSLEDDEDFFWQGLRFHLVRTAHYQKNEELAPSYGIFIIGKNKKIFITTDAQFTPEQFQQYFEEAGLIFHDCEILDKPSGVHATYDQLKTLPEKIKKKMWLYHYNSTDLPDAKKDGFLGFVCKGQQFTFE